MKCSTFPFLRSLTVRSACVHRSFTVGSSFTECVHHSACAPLHCSQRVHRSLTGIQLTFTKCSWFAHRSQSVSHFHSELQHERTVQNSDKVRKEHVQKGGRKRSKYIRNLIVYYKASELSYLKIQTKTVCYQFEISLIDIRAISPWSIRYRVLVFFFRKKV